MPVRHSTLPAALLVALAACASKTAPHPGESTLPRRELVAVGEEVTLIEPSAARARTAELALTVDRAWALLPAAYQALGLEATTIDTEQRLIGTQRQRVQGRLKGVRLSRYLDCGSNAAGIANADSYTITLDVSSQARPSAGSAEAEVSTLVRAVGRSSSTGSNTPINCPSRGQLEKQIAELVAQESAKAP